MFEKVTNRCTHRLAESNMPSNIFKVGGTTRGLMVLACTGSRSNYYMAARLQRRLLNIATHEEKKTLAMWFQSFFYPL